MLIAVGLGLGIGIVMALSGAGGGILAVPLLTFGLGLNVVQATPISLMAVGVAACFGALLGLKAGNLRYKAALLMAVGGILMSPVGMAIAHAVNNRWLSIFFALMMLFVAWRSLRQAGQGTANRKSKRDGRVPCGLDPVTGRFIWNVPCALTLAASGCVAGLFSGLLGVGGGFVMVPLMKRYTDLAIQSVVSTSLGVIALISFSGVLISSINGQVDWRIVVPFSLGGLIGMFAGRTMGLNLGTSKLERIYAVIVAAVAVIMIVKTMT